MKLLDVDDVLVEMIGDQVTLHISHHDEVQSSHKTVRQS
jgi:hypothetical protein